MDLLIKPLDLSQFDETLPDQGGTFTDLANQELAGTDDDLAGIDSDVADALSLIGVLDAATTAQDADLDAILALLNTQDPAPIGGELDAFGAAQPTGQALLDDINAIPTPQLKSISMLQPDGGAVVVLGGPPSQGGVAQSGGAPYTYHLVLFPIGNGIHNVDADGGQGPNPPFASFGPVVQETDAAGVTHWVYLVQINPQTPGTFTAQAQYIVNVTITGITGTLTRTQNFQVVIQAPQPGAAPPPVAAPPQPAPPPVAAPPPPAPPTLPPVITPRPLPIPIGPGRRIL